MPVSGSLVSASRTKVIAQVRFQILLSMATVEGFVASLPILRLEFLFAIQQPRRSKNSTTVLSFFSEVVVSVPHPLHRLSSRLLHHRAGRREMRVVAVAEFLVLLDANGLSIHDLRHAVRRWNAMTFRACPCWSFVFSLRKCARPYALFAWCAS